MSELWGSMIYIYDKYGHVRFSTQINIGSREVKELMKEDYVELHFNRISPVAFQKGDYVILDRRYEIVDFVYPSYDPVNGAFQYKLRLDAYYWKWKNKILFYDRQGNKEASWRLTRTPDAHLSIICSNLAALGYDYNGTPFTFVIDASVDMSAKLIEYNGTNIIDALTLIAEKWECEWWVEDNIIHLGKCEYGTSSIVFELEQNVQTMDRSDSNDNFATRVIAFGSDRNIPTNYRENSGTVTEAVVQKRLMLPEDTPYVDAYPYMTTEEAVEGIIIFDDIYPRRVGTMSNVHIFEREQEVEQEDGSTKLETFKYWRYKDVDLIFKEEYVIPGKELRITFTSGALNGMDFGVKFNPKPSEGDDIQLWEIEMNEDYGRALPNDSLCPVDGDEYILYGFDISFVSDTYIPAAEAELKQRTETYVEKSKQDPSVYRCPMNMTLDGINEYMVGDKVTLINPAYFKNGRDSRIYGYERQLDCSATTYIVGDTARYSRLAEVENEIKEITYNGNIYSGSGSGVYVIGKNDTTIASDRNVFSSLRSKAEFLSKKYGDTAQGLIKFLKGVEFGEFAAGLLGSGGAVNIDENGNSHAEVDYLTVRKIAKFVELMIEKYSHIGGSLVLSPARMICSKVEEYDAYYRCFFEQKDGDREITNDFVVGDQARCQTFNIKTGTNVSNQYYWRLITGIGTNYIDLSKTDQDADSTIPQVGDDIVQLGNRTNKDRQSAIILTTTDSDAPAIKQYAGINSYSLAGREVTVLSPKGNKLTGKVEIEAGSTDAANLSDLPEEVQKAVEIGAVNILRNSSFTGDYESLDLNENLDLGYDTDLYSPAMIFWQGEAEVVEDLDSASGFACLFTTLKQTLLTALINDEKYILSFRAKGGDLTIRLGSFTVTQTLSDDYDSYTYKINAQNATELQFSGNGVTICEIQLERGTIQTDWRPSPYDNNKFLAEFEALRYMSDALKGMTTILGGLVLTSMIQLGKYEDGALKKINAGISGIYNDDNDVAFWAGGTLEQAIATVMAFVNDPTKQLTDEQWEQLANIVITHGGRAILNDAIIRGTIYAKDGEFNGTVYAKDGKFTGEVNATSGTFKGRVEASEGFFKGTVESGNEEEDRVRLYSGVGEKGLSLISREGYNIADLLFVRSGATPETQDVSAVLRMKYYNSDGEYTKLAGIDNEGVKVYAIKNGIPSLVATLGAINRERTPSQAYLNLKNLAKSTNGLITGDVWNDNGTLKIVQ